MDCAFFSLPLVGPVMVLADGGALLIIHPSKGNTPATSSLLCTGTEKELLAETKAQLTAYIEGRLRTFDLPVDLQGEDFQVRVWKELAKIPRGETRAFQELARAAGSPRGISSAARACRSNPLPLIFPCHRALSLAGEPRGFSLGNADLQRRILALEGVFL